MTRPEPTPESVIRTLQREFDLRLISRLIISVVLIFSAMVILAALSRCNYHREHTAQLLGISVRTLHNKLNRYSLQ